MPLIVDDEFYELAREHSLPDCSVSFLMRAGSWSARNSRSGFVPSSMLADFSGDPGQATRTLLAAGFLKRAKSGVRIAEGCGLTVVNASDIAEKVTRDKGEAEQRRAEWRERKRRQRDAKTAERREQIAAGVTPQSREPEADVTRDKAEIAKKQQVKGSYVPRDIGVTSRGTPQIDRSDLNQSIGGSQVDARAREDPAVTAVTAVIEAVRAKAGLVLDAPEAVSVIAKIRARPKTPRKIRDPAKYFTAAIENEADLYADLLGEPPPSLQVILSEPPADHPAAERHPYDLDPKTGTCTCEWPRSNWRHEEARLA